MVIVSSGGLSLHISGRGWYLYTGINHAGRRRCAQYIELSHLLSRSLRMQAATVLLSQSEMALEFYAITMQRQMNPTFDRLEGV